MARRPEPHRETQLARVTRERDLYLRLLDLGVEDRLDRFLADALEVLVDASNARKGVLELGLCEDTSNRPRGAGATSSDGDGTALTTARGCSNDELAHVRETMSRGIVARALSTGQTVETASASTDPLFASRRSVKLHRIEAVLCVPILGTSTRGVVYLQDRVDGGRFAAGDRRRAETVARHLAPIADRLLDGTRDGAGVEMPRRYLDLVRRHGLGGRSASFAAVLDQVRHVAPLDVTVLFGGASGTGKTTLARLLHDASHRAGGPFVEVSCASLPETLVESELFGAVPGAHSTATKRMTGKIAAAEGGTLFLDEVGELPASAQARLLQFLQSRRYYPLGASHQETADVRLVAATNRDLQAAVAARQFREDLYWRLHVVHVRLPSLSERRTDLPSLVRQILEAVARKHRLPACSLSPAAVAAIETAEWPGNVRQLAHTLEAALIRASAERARVIERETLFPDARGDDPPEPASYQQATRRFQRHLLLETLDATGWNVVESARRLDVARSYLYDLLRAHGIERTAGPPSPRRGRSRSADLEP
ncbi:MAG: sigma-54-dependent Fis family transcriptional regulator [Deltaproteobacteria bacterium]|nr:sigma-54-dependent Fis family transcriptional regulator [Deltaproteobacteria bacterium]